MMILSSPDLPTLRLRQAATPEDCEHLRIWKNAHRQHFFFKDEITPVMQAAWFSKHLARKWDVMMLVEERVQETDAFTPTGCMGYRLQEDGTIDLYNILRGQRLAGSPTTMGKAFGVLLTWLSQTYALPLQCVVITENPARQWYEGLGFEVREDRTSPEPHVLYQLNPVRLPSQTVKLTLT